jgi:hypothetical protein
MAALIQGSFLLQVLKSANQNRVNIIMNRFIIEHNPRAAAQSLCDKHVPKMVVEEAQMLSAVHRLLDGNQKDIPVVDQEGLHVYLKSGRRRTKKHWVLPDAREDNLYKVAHANHPCTIWARQTLGNYNWAVRLLMAMCDEYTHRYNKKHKSESLLPWLISPPVNIDQSLELTPMPLAMGSNPECIDPSDVVGSYRKFYETKQERFKMVWTKRDVPSWFCYK